MGIHFWISGRGINRRELRLKKYMCAVRIRLSGKHLVIPGQPDFPLQNQKIAVFVDGCFWHGCPKCFRLPRQNRAFWKKKIEGNRRRDRSVNGRLRRLGWKSLRIRECNLKHPNKVLDKIKAVI
jgi:DNA mismatch endonuclease (patch repair protein)